MEKRRVVITGLGTVNPLGNNVADSWAAARAGKCGIGPITQFDTTDFKCKLAGEVKDFDPETVVDKKEVRKMARFTLLALGAAAEAIAARTPQGEVPFENEAQRLAEIIRLANDELLRRAQAALSPEMETATQEYIEKLRVLADTFQKVDEQSARLAHDSEEMANLNRTLTAINKTYDLHFKSISQQVGTIERINEQTRHLAAQIEELNGVYGRMIQALTINMHMQQPMQQQPQQPMQQGFQLSNPCPSNPCSSLNSL